MLAYQSSQFDCPPMCKVTSRSASDSGFSAASATHLGETREEGVHGASEEVVAVLVLPALGALLGLQLKGQDDCRMDVTGKARFVFQACTSNHWFFKYMYRRV